MEVIVSTSVPGVTGAATLKVPSAAAVVVTGDAAVPLSVLTLSTSIVAPGLAVPITITGDPETALRSAGAVTLSAASAGGGFVTYRSATTLGVSTGVPAPSPATSRTNWAADHVSGAAEPAGPPLRNPIEATVGSVPYGEAARSGSSQFCSGIRSTPEANLAMPSSSRAAVVASPTCSACSPRSPDSTGHRWPVP